MTVSTGTGPTRHSFRTASGIAHVGSAPEKNTTLVELVPTTGSRNKLAAAAACPSSNHHSQSLIRNNLNNRTSGVYD